MKTTPATEWSPRLLAFGAVITSVLPCVLSGQAEDPVYQLDELVVTGAEFDAFRAAIQNQRDADNIKTVVDAGAFGDVTEGNVGEFLKYLPGVSVDSVSADVRSVSVRGLNSNFTPVTMDGNRMASAASSSSSRTFEFEQVSLNNVARIEVTKVPTPANEADSLGGSVNMVSRNAFELDGRKLDYRAYFNVPEDYIRSGRTPGPGSSPTRKIRPGFDFTYSDPITENFGVVINYMRSEAFTPQDYFITQWDTIRPIGKEDPFLRYFNLRDGPKLSQRESFGFKADYRITPRSVLSFGYQLNDYSTKFFNREVRWETNTAIGKYGPEFTLPNSLTGRFRHQVNVREKLGQTNHIDLGMKHFLGDWQITYDGYYSKSENNYRDTENGHFERVSFRTPGQLEIGFLDIGDNGPAEVMTRLDGVDYNPYPLTDFSELEQLRSSPAWATDTIYGAKADIRRDLTIADLPVSLQVGALFRNQERDIEREQYDYRTNSFFTTRGPGSSGFIDQTYAGRELGWGRPAPEWPSVYDLYSYFQTYPEQLTLQEISSVIYNEENRQRVEETVMAGYAMGTVSLMDGKLKILGGVRYERTETEGEGYEADETILYQRDENGILKKKNPATPGNPQNWFLLPEYVGLSQAERIRVIYSGRRTTKNSYDDFYPSLHLTYQATDKLQLRAAYARTLGRPDIADLAPGIRYNSTTVGNDDGQQVNYITVSNPELKSYTGDNYDLSLEYYFDGGGVLSLGVFYKEISGYIDEDQIPLSAALAEIYGIDQSYVELGWEVRRTINAGDVKIKGYEISFIQELRFLPDYLRGFSVFANATALSSDANLGSNQELLVTSYIPGFVKQTVNWGLTYDRGPVDIRLKWNFRGKQMRDNGTVRGTFADHLEPTVQNPLGNPSRWNRFYDERLTMDLNFEYRFSKAVRLFLNGRNIFNEPTDQLRLGAGTPEYAQLERRERFGALWSVGVKGTF